MYHQSTWYDSDQQHESLSICLNYEMNTAKNTLLTQHWGNNSKNILGGYKSPWTTHNSIKCLPKSPTAESDSMHSTSGFSEILLVMVGSRRRRHASPVFLIRPIFVALHAKSHLINGFLVMSEASLGSRCTMWPSVFVRPVSRDTFLEINTPFSESPSSSCHLHLFIFFHQSL